MYLAAGVVPPHHAALALALAAVAALGLWAGLVAIVRALTGPRFDAPLPSTMELGRESPAVASVLAHRWKVVPEAARATLIDLAARRYFDIDHLGPGEDVIRLRRRPPNEDLAPYERRVLDHVRSHAHNGVVPLGALDLGDSATASVWWQRFEDEVISEARAAGLSRFRWSWALFGVLVGTALAPSLLAALAAASALSSPTSSGGGGGMWLALPIWLVLSVVAARLRPEVDTPHGRAVASRWQGVQAHLGGDEVFPTLGPSAVTVWGRYLPYGAALGAAPAAAAAVPLGPEDAHEAWSPYGGRWRRVRIRVPKRRPGWGLPPSKVAVTGLVRLAAAAAIAVIVVPLSLNVILPFARDGRDVEGAFRWMALLIGSAPLILAVLYGNEGVQMLFWSLPDLKGPTEVQGLVLRRRRVSGAGDPTSYQVVIDDGRSDTIDQWPVAAELWMAVTEAQPARARVARRTGHVFSLEPAGTMSHQPTMDEGRDPDAGHFREGAG